MPQWLAQNRQWVTLAVIVGFALLNVLFNYLAAQAKKKKALERQQRELEESIRTGTNVARPGDGLRTTTAESMDPGRARREDIARKRREQLEELRRRAAAKSQSGSAQREMNQAGMSSTNVGIGKPAARRQVPATVSGLDPAAMERKRREETRASGAARREVELREIESDRVIAETRVLAQAQSKLLEQASAYRTGPSPVEARQAALARPAGPVLRNRFSVTNWRQAMIMSELLAPPISLRGQDGSGGGEVFERQGS